MALPLPLGWKLHDQRRRLAGVVETAASIAKTSPMASDVSTSFGRPLATIRPSFKRQTRSATDAARLRSCRTASTVLPDRKKIPRDREHPLLMGEIEARGRFVQHQQPTTDIAAAVHELRNHARELDC